MSLTSKFASTLCLIVLTNGPKEKPVYFPVADFLFSQGLTPVEVRSSGEALIQTRQAKFFLVVISDDDHDLIKKIKSENGLNADTIVIAIASAEDVKESTQELLDANIVHHIVHKSSDLGTFHNTLIEAIKSHLPSTDNKSKENVTDETQCQDVQTHVIQNSQSAQSYQTQAGLASQAYPTYIMSSPSHLPNILSNQAHKPDSASNQLQQPYFANQSHPPFTGQSFPLQPFALIPPMIVPYHSLMHNSSVHSDAYMMPRIVDFGAIHEQMATQVHRNFPGYNDCPTINPAPLLQDNGGPGSTNNNGPVTESTSENTSQDKNQPQDKLPGFEKFLECLNPEPKEFYEGKATHENHDENQREAKRPRLEASTMCDDDVTVSSTVELDVEAKNPLSILQTRPYFMNIDEQMEEMAFDPKVKASDRHNAKERHRRIRITKAAEFFKETIPCMNPGMDKATSLQLTVYYIIFLRNALHQIDPNIVHKLHKSYKEEWKPYFEKEAAMQTV